MCDVLLANKLPSRSSNSANQIEYVKNIRECIFRFVLVIFVFECITQRYV